MTALTPASRESLRQALKAERSAADLAGYYDGSLNTGKDYRKARKATDKAASALLAQCEELQTRVDAVQAILDVPYNHNGVPEFWHHKLRAAQTCRCPCSSV